MELTRHFTATTYVVADGATALHRHDRIGKWLPPGGHVERAELPHEAALREVREETGLDATLVAERDAIESATVRALPQPRHVQLADVNVYDGRAAGSDGSGCGSSSGSGSCSDSGDSTDSSADGARSTRQVGHQHVDLVYYAAADERAIQPAGTDEQPAEDWEWFDAGDLERADVDADVTEIGRRAIETVADWRAER